MSRSYSEPVDFKVLRIKRALQRLGLDVTEASTETVLDLYERLAATWIESGDEDRKTDG